MSIIVNNRLFTLNTANSTYQFTADAYGIFRHLYYGARVDNTDFS